MAGDGVTLLLFGILPWSMLGEWTEEEKLFFQEQQNLRDRQMAAIHEQKVDIDSVMICSSCKKKTIRFVTKAARSKDEPDNVLLVCESCGRNQFFGR